MHIYALAMHIYAWERYHAVVISPTFNPFYPDVTHVRKDTGPLPLFHTARDGKLGGGWE